LVESPASVTVTVAADRLAARRKRGTDTIRREAREDPIRVAGAETLIFPPLLAGRLYPRRTGALPVREEGGPRGDSRGEREGRARRLAPQVISSPMETV
jgi:hypothetical protein